VRRMRRLYAARQAALVAAAQRHLGDFLTVAPDDAGLHLMAWLTPAIAERLGDRGAAEAAAAAGIAVSPLSDYFTGPPDRHGLLLGYAAVPEDEIERGAARLAEALGKAI
jgi:GntR family transcriptional regulator / MocR family aminotransferase